VIEMRRAQLSFGDGLIAGEVSDLREGWMTHADRVLADEQIVGAVYEALARRHPRTAVVVGRAHRPRWCCGC
jgi:transposase, IS5 family